MSPAAMGMQDGIAYYPKYRSLSTGEFLASTSNDKPAVMLKLQTIPSYVNNHIASDFSTCYIIQGETYKQNIIWLVPLMIHRPAFCKVCHNFTSPLRDLAIMYVNTLLQN